MLWSAVKRNHIELACKLFDTGSIVPSRAAKNTFVVVHGRTYPAKFILGEAYTLATGRHLDPSHDYSGGSETARRLRRLGFDVQYQREKRNRPTAQARIVTVSIRGVPSKAATVPGRIDLVQTITEGICNRSWSNLDAVVLPGGFFFLEERLGRRDYAGRRSALDESAFGSTARKCCRALRGSPGLVFTAGVDGPQDQFCVAWSSAGIVGIARKIFPTPADSAAGFYTSAADYDSERRMITLQGGRRALLCSCYDMFGLTETPGQVSTRTNAIKRIVSASGVIPRHGDVARKLRRDCIERWSAFLRKCRPTIAIGAIHRFERPGLDLYWQRHGIATASAAIDGLVVAAAHFKARLPSEPSSTLAAAGVPSKHLESAGQRKAHHLGPVDAFSIGEDALVRLFQA